MPTSKLISFGIARKIGMREDGETN